MAIRKFLNDYAIEQSDFGSALVAEAATQLNFTLPPPNTPGADIGVTLICTGAGGLSLTAPESVIFGAALTGDALVIPQYGSVVIRSDDSFWYCAGGSGGSSGVQISGVTTTIVNLSQSDILNSNTTPVPVVPAQGAGVFAIIVASSYESDFGTTPYSGGNGGLYYKSDGSGATADFGDTGVFTSGSTAREFTGYGGNATADPADLDNQPIVYFNPNTPYTGGDGTGVISASWITVPPQGTGGAVGPAGTIQESDGEGNLVAGSFVETSSGIFTNSGSNIEFTDSSNTTGLAIFTAGGTTLFSSGGFASIDTNGVWNVGAPSGPSGSVGDVNITGSYKVNGIPISAGSITGFTTTLNTASPNDSVNASEIQASGGTFSQDFVAAPVGYGAFLLTLPTGDSIGGNKRGEYAVDLQIFAPGKNSATQVASGYYSYAEGISNTASGAYSHVEGSGNIASGNSSHAEGNSTTASGNVSHAEGGNTQASGLYSHAEGYANVASGTASHAEGDNNTASGDYSHVEGGTTQATNTYDHAEGSNTTASGGSSHAEGSASTASGPNSHAEGAGAQATGAGSHAEGVNTIAAGLVSHAEGEETQATGNRSHTEGFGSIDRGIQGYHASCSPGYQLTLGDNQLGRVSLSCTPTTDTTPTVLLSDSSGAPSAFNQVTLPPNSTFGFHGWVVAQVVGGGVASSYWSFTGLIKQGADAGATALVGSVVPSVIAQDAGASTWSIAVTADTTNGSLAVTVTGEAATNISWLARIETEELAI
jgi:hypothetical protein